MWDSGTRTRVAFKPFLIGKGVYPLRLCGTVFLMDLNSLLEPVIAFFSDGIGAVIRDVLVALYEILYPANAEAAKPFEIG